MFQNVIEFKLSPNYYNYPTGIYQLLNFSYCLREAYFQCKYEFCKICQNKVAKQEIELQFVLVIKNILQILFIGVMKVETFEQKILISKLYRWTSFYLYPHLVKSILIISKFVGFELSTLK